MQICENGDVGCICVTCLVNTVFLVIFTDLCENDPISFGFFKSLQYSTHYLTECQEVYDELPTSEFLQKLEWH